MTASCAFTYAAIALCLGGLAHIIGYFMGPEAIAFMGAPPETVQSVGDGTWPGLVTCFFIAAVLFGVSFLSYRAAAVNPGRVSRFILIFFAVIFTVRGVAVVFFIPAMFRGMFDMGPAKFWFHFFASLFVLSIGFALTKGLVKTAGHKT